MAKNQNSKTMTDAELTAFAALWVGNNGDGTTAADKARMLEDTNLTEDQVDTVTEKIEAGNFL